MKLTNDRLDFWLSQSLNVLLMGEKGTGKTSMVTSAFTRANLRWKSFSAGTMDPWVDFIGVPEKVTNKEGITYLEMIRPEAFATDSVDALFFDEINRASKKVRNAVMELIQFKSINGKKFNNLKIVWAAANPDDGNYDVESLDPAMLDRFHIHFNVPYAPDREYFTEKFGNATGIAAIEWWESLPSDMQKQVSPRRLDYAVSFYQNKGDLREMITDSCNPSALASLIRNGPLSTTLQTMFATKDIPSSEKFFLVDTNYTMALPSLLKNMPMLSFFLPTMPTEKISSLIAADAQVFNCAMLLLDTNTKVQNIVAEIISANTNKVLIKQLRRAIKIKSDDVKKAMKYIEDVVIEPPKKVAPAYHAAKPREKISVIIKRCATTLSRFGTRRRGRYWRRRHERFDNAYADLIANLPKKMMTKEALGVLKICSCLINRSKNTVYRDCPNVFGFINTCLDVISEKEKLTYGQIADKFNTKRILYLFSVIKRKKFSAYIYPI